MESKILHGDCLELMKDIPDGSIDMILCDLPYGTTACKWDTIIPFEPLWEQYERIIKPNGAVVLTASQPFTSALVMSNPKLFKYEWIWEKTKASNFQLAKLNPLKFHENILVFYKNLPTYNQLTLEDCYIKSGRGTDVRQLKHCKDSKDYVTTKTGYNRSVIKVANPSGKGHPHPTAKPIPLMETLLKIYTNEGEMVLDNCAGSFTTAIACLNTNRHYICMEKEKKYFDIGEKRIADWHKAHGQTSLLKELEV
jgi:site-specific DNA-methyltransferase (adenine-specific)